MTESQTAERRVFFCEACGGDGGFDEECLSIGGYVRVEHFRCPACGGSGKFEAELLPVTGADMEELAHEAA